MSLLRSLLFIPADRKKMVDKIDILKPDVFILDLEDSVSIAQKKTARDNIFYKVGEIDLKNRFKDIFIRVNDLDSEYIYEDINETISSKISGYMIPKFESIDKVKEIVIFISKKEKEKDIPQEKIKLILMIENAKGIIELNNIEKLPNRVIAIAFGGEDYLSSISLFSGNSFDMLDFARKMVLLYSNSRNLLAIDTVYKNYKDLDGLKIETDKIVRMGFNGKLAIHPNQIEIINKSFTPTNEEIKRMETILKHKDKIKKEGVISIDGIMFDLVHLKWAQKIKDYLAEIDR